MFKNIKNNILSLFKRFDLNDPKFLKIVIIGIIAGFFLPKIIALILFVLLFLLIIGLSLFAIPVILLIILAFYAYSYIENYQYKNIIKNSQKNQLFKSENIIINKTDNKTSYQFIKSDGQKTKSLKIESNNNENIKESCINEIKKNNLLNDSDFTSFCENL